MKRQAGGGTVASPQRLLAPGPHTWIRGYVVADNRPLLPGGLTCRSLGTRAFYFDLDGVEVAIVMAETRRGGDPPGLGVDQAGPAHQEAADFDNGPANFFEQIRVARSLLDGAVRA